MDVQVIKLYEEFPEQWERSLFIHTSQSCQNEIEETLHSAGLSSQTVIFIPFDQNGACSDNSEQALAWEESSISFSDMIIFWLPLNATPEDLGRCLLTFGRWASSGKVIYGHPANKTPEDFFNYLNSEDNGNEEQAASQKTFGKIDQLARCEDIKINNTFADCLEQFKAKTKNGATRQNSERNVPLHIWNHAAFKHWYGNMRQVGNRLDGAVLKWAFCVGPNKAFTLYWVLHVNIYVTSEERNKSNEIVLARNDTKHVFPYYIPEASGVSELDCEVVLIKEFRSPARTEDGFIHELPGGSAFKAQDPLVEALTELREETSLVIDDPSRVQNHGARQHAGTTSAHQGHLFSVALTKEEIEVCREIARANKPLGNIAETERTYVEVHKLRDLLETNTIDWSTLGMIHYVLHRAFDTLKHEPLRQLQPNLRSMEGTHLPIPVPQKIVPFVSDGVMLPVPVQRQIEVIDCWANSSSKWRCPACNAENMILIERCENCQLAKNEDDDDFLMKGYDTTSLQRLLEGKKNVLVLGMGGGSDIFMAYLMAKDLNTPNEGTGHIMYASCISEQEQGLPADHVTFIPEVLYAVPRGSPRPLVRGESTGGTTLLEQSVPRGAAGSPLLIVLKSNSEAQSNDDVQALTEENVHRVKQAFEYLKADLVIGIDCGGVSITGGKDYNFNVLTESHQQIIYACRMYRKDQPNFSFMHIVLGPGCDGKSSEQELKDAILGKSSEQELKDTILELPTVDYPLRHSSGRTFLGCFTAETFIEECFQFVQNLETNEQPFVMYRALKNNEEFPVDRPQSGDVGLDASHDLVLICNSGNSEAIPRRWLTHGLVFSYNPEKFQPYF